MNQTEFETNRSVLITRLNQLVGQSNWRLASEVCADLQDIEAEWLTDNQRASSQAADQYAPVVNDMNDRLKTVASSEGLQGASES